MTSKANIDLSFITEAFPNHFPLHDMKGFVIGIAGKAGSGKDTFASLLYNEMSKFVIAPKIDIYARPIKEAYVAKYGKVLGFTYEDTHDYGWKLLTNPFTNTTHRQEFQFDGTEGTRTRTGNPNVWVQHLWLRNMGGTGVLLVPDTRFDNEIAFSRLNGMLIKVVRPDQPDIEQSNHASEVVVGDEMCDFIVHNTGTLEALAGIAESLVKLIFDESQKFAWWEDKKASALEQLKDHRKLVASNLDYARYIP
jgi:hypothetical protein